MVTRRFRTNSLEGFEQLGVGDAEVAGEVPRQVLERDNRLVALELVPLVAVAGQLELLEGHRAHVPRNVVTPALQQARSLSHWVTRYINCYFIYSYNSIQLIYRHSTQCCYTSPATSTVTITLGN